MKMIKLIRLIAFVCICTLSSCTQEDDDPTIYNGDIVFLTQQQIDDFGEKEYTSIIGSVTVGDTRYLPSDITNLNGLGKIITIGKDLNIIHNNELEDFEGLHNLISIGEEFWIQSNENLTNVDQLNSLTSVGSLEIRGNRSLHNINGFSKLSGGIDGILISGNASLTQVDGLLGLSTISDILIVSANASLLNIDGFMNTIDVQGGLIIQENSSLTNIDGLGNLSNIDGGLIISSNPILSNIDGLHKLSTISGALTIDFNEAITNLNGLSNLSSADGIKFTHNRALNNFCAVQPLIVSTQITFFIYGNAYNPWIQKFIAGECSL
jgi:hypothetical protein